MLNPTQISILKIENLSTGYGKKQVLYDVSFEVNKGEIVLLAGSNGSGKSTLLKAIYGILPFWEGSVNFEGKVIQSATNSTLNIQTSKLITQGVMYIPQKDSLFEDLTVKENLEMAGLILESKVLKQRIENALLIFTSLVPNLKRSPMKLSGGERQMLTLAMATLHQPKMIMIDEPFSGLSPNNITFVADNLKILNEKSGITLLIVEHRVKESLLLANRIISLKLGRVFSKFEVNETFNINELNSVFV